MTKRILVYGDSNSHGTVPMEGLGGKLQRFPPGVPWPDQLATYTGYTVLNEGLPGRTTVHEDPIDGGARNGAAVLPAMLLSHAPLDLVILMLGTNDLKPRFATSAFDIAKSVERLVRITKGILPDVRVLVICPVSILEYATLADAFAGGQARQEGLADFMDAALCGSGASLAFADDYAKVSLVDGVHLDAQSHTDLALGIMPHVEKLLAPPGFYHANRPAPDPDAAEPPVTLLQVVPKLWEDYNGHMNEAHYLTAFSHAADQMLAWSGMEAAQTSEGASVFTVETHIRHLAEVQIGDEIRVTTRVVQGGGKKLHLWHEMWVNDTLCATGEQLLLHMSLRTRTTQAPPKAMADWLSRAQAAHAPLPLPEGFQRYVAQR